MDTLFEVSNAVPKKSVDEDPALIEVRFNVLDRNECSRRSCKNLLRPVFSPHNLDYSPTIMKLVIPMAGRGTRLRPHTHVTPKPLLPVVGIPMVERIVNTFIEVLPRPITEAVFILGDFPSEVNEALTAICERHGLRASFVRQDQALGTGHAIHCARDYLDGEIITVFADTLFTMDGPVPVLPRS